ncbi:hypothetical protein PHET_03821 [Paragonimus heterotremus]|uniref:Uncharacterized protein n=1 Tax=Paragonimus heterotremus TaxID=100268 RepID=A0A8J4TA95_9TREM|nr:hypothetical protein PHET_03821 [Paragonimus heterotremus]
MEVNISDPIISLSRRQKQIIRRRFVHAHIQLSSTKHAMDTVISRMNVPTTVQLCFAIRQGIDNTIMESFGDLSGAPIRCYDLLLCRQDQVVSRESLTWTFVLSIPDSYVPQILTALSFVSSTLGGAELLHLLVESTSLNRDDFSLFVDVLGVYPTMFDLPLDM